jgi:hypothetical protein
VTMLCDRCACPVCQMRDVRMSSDPTAPENAVEVVTTYRIFVLAPEDDAGLVSDVITG